MKHCPVHPGDTFTMEGRLAYKFSEYSAPEASGYSNWQVTSDRGNDVNWGKSSKYKVYGADPHERILLPFIKPWGLLTIIGW